jgi:hypothetical protein
MTYLSVIVFFMIMLCPFFPPVILAGVDAVQWSYARVQKLIRKPAKP